MAQTATTWLANTGHGLDDPAALIATIKRLDNRHVDYRLRLNLLRRLEGKAIDGDVRRELEGMYIDRYRGATLTPTRSCRRRSRRKSPPCSGR